MSSYIEHGSNGLVAFVGEDATRVFAAAVLRSSIKLWLATGMIPTRGVGITHMLARASQLTGKSYRRGDASMAVRDLTAWVDVAVSRIPVRDASQD